MVPITVLRMVPIQRYRHCMILRMMCRTLLLIVPYGIETKFNERVTMKTELLLIVPYGIETMFGCSLSYTQSTF